MCPNFGTPKRINFPFGRNGKLIILGVPILKNIMVYKDLLSGVKLYGSSFSSI